MRIEGIDVLIADDDSRSRSHLRVEGSHILRRLQQIVEHRNRLLRRVGLFLLRRLVCFKSPAVTVTKTARNLPNTDYKVTYPKNRTAVGTYVVTVTGLGKYTGAKNLKYKIVPPLVKKIKKPKRYKRKLVVQWYALRADQRAKYKSAITGFQVRVSKSSKFKKAKYGKVKGYARSSATVKGLKRSRKE